MSNTRAAVRQYFGSFGLCMIFALVYVFAPLVETRLFPVVSPFTPTGYLETVGGIEAQGGAEKFRDCDYRGLMVYLGHRPNGVPLRAAEFRDPPTIRAPGRLEWNRLYVPVPWSLFLTDTYADALHSCYGDERILTRSRFWN